VFPEPAFVRNRPLTSDRDDVAAQAPDASDSGGLADALALVSALLSIDQVLQVREAVCGPEPESRRFLAALALVFFWF